MDRPANAKRNQVEMKTFFDDHKFVFAFSGCHDNFEYV